jgi:hypothetical protein
LRCGSHRVAGWEGRLEVFATTEGGIAPARGGPLVFDGAGQLLFVPGLGTDARAWAPAGAPQWGLRWIAGEGGDTPRPFAPDEATLSERRTRPSRGKALGTR